MNPLCQQCFNGGDYCHLRELYTYFGRKDNEPKVSLVKDTEGNWHCDGYRNSGSAEEENHGNVSSH